MKLAGAEPSPAVPPMPSTAPVDAPPANDSPNSEAAPSDKPFDSEPFNAGVEADENSDPKKYIEQLTGKLGQSLRKYNEQQGQPDFELEKFAINSLLSATHTAEMDSEDQKDIINKIQKSGNDSESEISDDSQTSNEEPNADSGDDIDFGGGNDDFSDEKDLGEGSLFLDKPKKNNMFQPNSNDILKEKLEEKLERSGKNSIFGKYYLKSRLTETFNQEETMNNTPEPEVALLYSQRHNLK